MNKRREQEQSKDKFNLYTMKSLPFIDKNGNDIEFDLVRFTKQGNDINFVFRTSSGDIKNATLHSLLGELTQLREFPFEQEKRMHTIAPFFRAPENLRRKANPSISPKRDDTAGNTSDHTEQVAKIDAILVRVDRLIHYYQQFISRLEADLIYISEVNEPRKEILLSQTVEIYQRLKEGELRDSSHIDICRYIMERYSIRGKPEYTADDLAEYIRSKLRGLESSRLKEKKTGKKRMDFRPPR